MANTTIDDDWDVCATINTNGITWLQQPRFKSEEEGIWLAWNDMTVDVSVTDGLCKSRQKRIIHGSRGVARPGEVLAVLGPSGAGKTSLFNALAKRGRGYRVKGSLTLNGQPYDKAELKKCAGFVFQEPLFHSYIKTEEALRLAANLKLPGDMSPADKEERVQALLDAFDLRKCAKTKIGDSRVKGISGGEKKRLSIAIELLTGPSLLFLDEPTTGLDAASSLSVVKLLADLADNGTTVVTVIHQPRSTILEYIDTFLVLSDGRDIFFGGLQEMIEFFERVDLGIPVRTNPLDYVLDVINTESSALQELNLNASFADLLRKGRSRRRMPRDRSALAEQLGVEAFTKKTQRSRQELAKDLSAKFSSMEFFKNEVADVPQVFPALELSETKPPGFRTRLNALFRREWLQKVRNPEVFITQISMGIAIGLIMGSMYYNAALNLFDVASALSFGTLMGVFLVFHLVLYFPTEREIWLRDRDNGLYSSSEYYVATVVAGLPGDVLSSFLCAVCFYFLTGLTQTASAFFTFAGFEILCTSTGASMLYFAGAASPNSQVANSSVGLVLLFVMIFNGFFVVYESLGAWYKWIADINFIRFAFNAVLFNELYNKTYNCVVGVTCAYNTGNEELIFRGIGTDLQLWRMAVYMLCVWASFHFLAFLCVNFLYTGAVAEMPCVEARRKKREAKLAAAEE